MKEYLNDPEAMSKIIDLEGWIHTGDIGYVDDEEIFIVDRVKELIKFKGFQVLPVEIEGLLLTNPSIVDAVVVPQKSDVAGEVPAAFVVRSANEEGLNLTETAVKDFVAKQVIFYKKVHSVYFISTIPKSAARKILKKVLRDKLSANQKSQKP